MHKKEKLGIIYFRRDLRLEDNTALNHCINDNDYILPLFIFNSAQTNEKKNSYYSDKAFELLKHFLYELNEAYMKNFNTKHSILVDEGEPTIILNNLISNLNDFDVTLYFNIDFTPFAVQRDTEIFINLDKKINIKAYCDHLLVRINQLDEIIDYQNLYLQQHNSVYKKFTPFYNYYSGKNVKHPFTETFKKIKHYQPYKSERILDSSKYKFLKDYDRSAALRSISKDIKYHLTHNDVFDENGTFRISHYLKFGVISIREAYYAFKELTNPKARVAAIRQLYWRDFYTLLTWANPKLLGWQFNGFKSENPQWKKLKENSALYEKYNEIKWSHDAKIIEAWQMGKTGFPIVDAGMRQLLETGYMHNRVRLITASFLTKICGIDWRIGEQWFAQHLMDYDPIMNNSNWLWVAGGGADSQPYFRVFNPWLQQKEYDPHCIYIKRWIPELQDADIENIHKYYQSEKIKNYPSPIIDYKTEKERTLTLYKKSIY